MPPEALVVKKHIMEEQGGMSSEHWCPLEYPREKPQENSTNQFRQREQQQEEVVVAETEGSSSFEEQKGLYSCQICHQRNFSRDHHLRRHHAGAPVPWTRTERYSENNVTTEQESCELTE